MVPMIEFEIDRPYVVFVAAVLCAVTALAGARLAMYSRAVLDKPNERSSHSGAISRAGGLAMLAGFLAGIFVVAVFAGGAGLAGSAVKMAVLSIVAAAIGFADDRKGLSPLIKFAGQFFVALAFVWLIGPLYTAPVPVFGDIDLGVMSVPVTVFWIVAFMNVFNFMDGVNGLAGGAATLGLGFFALIAVLSGAGAAGVIALLGAIAAAGFLPANLWRGKLFMGDCGSHFLAFLIAGLAVMAVNGSDGRASALIVPVIFLPFIFDVAFTLAHRLLRKQNVLMAHREHLYQVILRRGASHATVAALYAGLVAFCVGAAVLMLAFPPAWRLAVPVVILVVFTFAGLRLFKQAQREELLAPAVVPAAAL